MDSNIWSNLSLNVLELIFARLPLQSLVRLRLLSKQWYSHLSSPAFQHAFSDGQPKDLAVVDFKRAWAYDAKVRRWHAIPLHYLPFHSVMAADGGLLCCVKFTKLEQCLQFVVCNPLTSAWRVLPSVVGVRMCPVIFHMKVDTQSRHYTIKFLGFNEQEAFYIYSSEINSWEKISYSRQTDVMGRYFLIDVNHGIIHTCDIHPGTSSGILFPPDFQDSVAQLEISFFLQAEEGHVFLLKSYSSKDQGDRVWSQDVGMKWEEFCRIPKADELEEYIFCVYLWRDVILLLGKKRELFYNEPFELDSEEHKLVDSGNAEGFVADQVNDKLMLMLDLRTKIWTDVTDHSIEPGLLSRFIIELRLDAIP